MSENIDVLSEIDNIIYQIKQINKSKQKIYDLYDARVGELKDSRDDKICLYDARIKNHEIRLMILCSQIEMKETRTQSKLDLLDGTLIIKKPKIIYNRDDNKIIDMLDSIGCSIYRKEKTTTSLDWELLKKNITVTNEGVVLNDTGELIPKEILSTSMSESVVKIK